MRPPRRAAEQPHHQAHVCTVADLFGVSFIALCETCRYRESFSGNADEPGDQAVGLELAEAAAAIHRRYAS